MNELSPRKKIYKIVIVSPHLDDAVFSCGGLIAENADQCLVINLFTAFSQSESSTFVASSAHRKDEELMASSFLKYDSIFLDFTDAAYRNDAYSKPFHLFNEPSSSESSMIDQVQGKLFQVLRAISFEQIYLPMGLGWHVDHLIAFECFPALKNEFKKTRFLFYEEVPYRFILNVRSERLQELKVPAPQAEHARSILRLASLPTFGVLSRWQVFQPVLCLVFSVFFFRKFRQRRSLRGTLESIQGLEPAKLDISASVDHKIEAMMLYQSQWKEFFRSPKHFLALAKDTDNRIYEYYWSVSDR